MLKTADSVPTLAVMVNVPGIPLAVSVGAVAWPFVPVVTVSGVVSPENVAPAPLEPGLMVNVTEILVVLGVTPAIRDERFAFAFTVCPLPATALSMPSISLPQMFTVSWEGHIAP